MANDLNSAIKEWRGPTLPMIRGDDGYFTSRSIRDLIKSSIYIILLTPIGSMFFDPEFGSNIFLLAFELNDEVLESEARLYTVDALNRWEPRIKILQTSVKSDKDTFTITIRYTIKSTQETVSSSFVMNREG